MDSKQLEMVGALFPNFHNNKKLSKLWSRVDGLLNNTTATPKEFSTLFGSGVAAVNPQCRFCCSFFQDLFLEEPKVAIETLSGMLEKHSRYLAAKDKAAHWENYITKEK